MIEQHKNNLINYTVQGDGPPVILIHGMGASLYDWEAMIPELVGAGYRTYAVDLLGHGDSLKPEEPGSYHSKTVYSYLEQWIDKLNLEMPPFMVGHSMGAYFSMRYGLRNPQKLLAMALVNPFYTPQQLSPVVRLLQRRPKLGEKALRVVPEWIFHALMVWDPMSFTSFPRDVRRQIAADLKRASPHIVYLPRTLRDLTPKLSYLTQKTLVIWGEKDFTLRPAFFSRLVDNLPNATGHAVPGCGHQPHILKSEIVNRVVLDFLQRLKAETFAPTIANP